MAKEPTLALTKKAKLTADRLTILMVKQYRKNASTSGFRPELVQKKKASLKVINVIHDNMFNFRRCYC